MVRPSICAAVICVLLFCCAESQANESVGETIQMRTQLLADVFLLKDYVERLMTEVEVLNKKSNTQINMLKKINDGDENRSSENGVCERISSYFNSTYRKYNQFEERIVTKLDEIQDEQTTNLNKILVRQNLSKNCQQDSALDVMSEALLEINDKISKFEIRLKTFETLEDKLKEQQTKSQSLNDEQMKLLMQINDKLSQHQEKFENFEKQLPNLLEVTTSVAKMASEKKHSLPIEVILGLAQNQTTSKSN